MISNIIDRRKRPYRWKSVNAVVEPTRHDNGCADSDLAEDGGGDLLCETLERSSLTGALAWAQGFDGQVTLYLYDDDDGL